MVKLKTKRSKIAFSFGIVIFCIAIVFFLLRGPYLSNYIKRIIVPQLENITRERVMIDKAVINLFPFYVQAKGLRIFDKDGNKLLWVTKTRAYIDLTALLAGEISVRKLTIKEPDMIVDENDLKRIIENVKKSLSVGEEGRFKVSFKNIQLTDGKLKYDDAAGRTWISGEGIFINMVTKRSMLIASLQLRKGMVVLPNGSSLHDGIDMKILMKDGKIEITELNIHSSKSEVSAKGNLLISQTGVIEGGSFDGSAKVYMSTINEMLGLKNEMDGVLSFEGTVDLVPGKDSKWPEVVLDLKTDSSFYLETLMEILKVEATVAGLVSVKGEIKGRFPEVVAKGFVRLENAMFDTLPLDDVAGEIEYRAGRFILNDFKAHTLGGELNGYAHIEMPDGDYMVTAGGTDINSQKLFKYIEWEPPFPMGRISGNFSLNQKAGRDFEIAADLDYINNASKDGDILDRIRIITTSLELKGDLLTLDDTVLSTSRSKLFLKGGMDLARETISLDLLIETEEVKDLTAPYYTEFLSAGIFSGSVGGSLVAPSISGTFNLDAGSLHGIPVSGVSGELKYNTDSLAFEKLRVVQNESSYDFSGLIEFREAEGFFSFKSPHFIASVSLQNAGIKQFVDLFSEDIPVEGIASGAITFEGDTKEFTGTGDLVITDAVVYEQDIAKAEFKTTFGPDRINIHSLNVYHGESNIAAEGTVFYDGKFDFTLSSENVDTCDINMIENHPLGVRFSSLKMSGAGSIKNPDIKFSGHIIESYLNEKEIGTGNIEGTFKDRNLQFKGAFVDGLLLTDARASFSEKTIWNADIDIKRGRYDFLLSGLIDKVPDDSTLSLKGSLTLRSQGGEHSIQLRFSHLSLGVGEYDLINDNDIVIEIVNRELFIKSLSLTGNSADVNASGSVKFNESYDVKLIGNMDISFLSSLSEKIGSLKGHGDYSLNIVGKWDLPEINGEINIKDATAVLTDLTYKIGPMNGKFIFDRGKVTFDSVKTGFAGGTVDMSGVGYLNELSMEKLYLSAALSDIRIRPLERVNVVFGGSLFYETSSEGASVMGNIDIKKAKYEKDVEFDKFIVGLKEFEGKRLEYSESLRNTALNIHIEGKEDILIDNNIATTPVKISLNIMGTVGQYGLIGKVDALGGNIYFRNNEFTILEGSSVEFVDLDSMVPVFHIRAESFISDYYIKLALDGTMDQFNLSLFSDPPLSETDMLTLLTFGQFKKGVKGFESGLAANEAASILTGDLQEAVESRFKNITGFERFVIEPHTASNGAFGPKITVGKRLINDKLSVIYSTSVGTNEEHIIKLKYNINKSVSIIGSRDEIGSAGIDLKYKFGFK